MAFEKYYKDIIIEIHELSEGQCESWINDLQFTTETTSSISWETLIDLRNKYKFTQIFKTFIFSAAEKVKSERIENYSTSAFIKNNREFIDSAWRQISRFNVYPVIQFFAFLTTIISF